MKLLSIAIPSYNSEAYLSHAVESLLPGGDLVEILIVNDGSTDGTARIADDYARRYPGLVRAVHKENGGHGDAVMAGLAAATGLYFKVVDSDDWVDEDAYPKLLQALSALRDEPVDLFISNYIYDKVGVAHPHVVNYRHALPQEKVFGWDETRHFRKGQYILMHSVIYRTELLKTCGLHLPKHTFYVDDLYVYVPLRFVRRMYYLDVDFYHYFIGREDQSVQEQIMLKRIDQFLYVNRLMFDEVRLDTVQDVHLRKYMLNFLEIITTISSVMLMRDGSRKALEKRDALWADLQRTDPYAYRRLRGRLLGRATHVRTRPGRGAVLMAYQVSRRVFGFN